jgi:hypothetical protein
MPVTVVPEARDGEIGWLRRLTAELVTWAVFEHAWSRAGNQLVLAPGAETVEVGGFASGRLGARVKAGDGACGKLGDEIRQRRRVRRILSGHNGGEERECESRELHFGDFLFPQVVTGNFAYGDSETENIARARVSRDGCCRPREKNKKLMQKIKGEDEMIPEIQDQSKYIHSKRDSMGLVVNV